MVRSQGDGSEGVYEYLLHLQVLLLLPLGSPMESVRSGWIMFSVLELRPDSLTVLLIQLEITTVPMLKMLE